MEYQRRGRSEESWGWEGVVRVGEKTRKWRREERREKEEEGLGKNMRCYTWIF